MKDFITLQDISYKEIFSQFSYSITKGQFVLVSGPSGVGKSTLFSLLNQTLSPDSGSISYHSSLSYGGDFSKIRQSVLLVSQSVFLFPGSILDNFSAFYAYRSLPSLSSSEVNYFLSLCVLDKPLDTPVSSLSGGERQRVYLAIFLSFALDVLLLDEPTSSLDSLTSSLVLQNILAFAKERNLTLLIISHDPILHETWAYSRLILGGVYD